MVVCPQIEDADALMDDLALFTGIPPERFPAWESLPNDQQIHDTVFGDRLRVLKQLQGPQPLKLLVASIQSLLQPVPDREVLERRTRSLRVGGTVAVEELARWLVENGFCNTPAVELPGEFSIRGGIVDIFAPDWDGPVRVELFGDVIESIRRFEVADQRSLATLESVDVTIFGPAFCGRSHLTDHLPPRSRFLLIEPMELELQGRHYLERLEHPPDFHTVSDALREVYHFSSVAAWAVAAASLETTCRLKIESVDRFSGDINKVHGELDEAGAGQQVYLVCQTEAEVRRRLSEVFRETDAAKQGRLQFIVGTLQNGFRLVSERIVLLSSGELFRRADLRRPSRRRLSRVIDSFLELREGDLVVHVGHGVARYRGLKLLEKNGQVEEHLELEFQGGTKLYVPATKIGLVQKYVGGSKSRPTLARLGGRMWGRQKQRAEEAVGDLAADMLELQAAQRRGQASPFPAIPSGNGSSTHRFRTTKQATS